MQRVGDNFLKVAALALCSLDQCREGRSRYRHGDGHLEAGVAGLNLNLCVGELLVERVRLVVAVWISRRSFNSDGSACVSKEADLRVR
jgi:hypothetical protein